MSQPEKPEARRSLRAMLEAAEQETDRYGALSLAHVLEEVDAIISSANISPPCPLAPKT